MTTTLSPEEQAAREACPSVPSALALPVQLLCVVCIKFFARCGCWMSGLKEVHALCPVALLTCVPQTQINVEKLISTRRAVRHRATPSARKI